MFIIHIAVEYEKTIVAVDNINVYVSGWQGGEERALHERKSSRRADKAEVGGRVCAEEEAGKSSTNHVGTRAEGKP